MAGKLVSYKYCLVPKCMNTNRSTPEKYFFPVPRHKKIRKRWCNAMNRVDREPLSYKTSLHCCEDHFDIERDIDNYIKYKLVGGRMILKPGILPHTFNCQLCDENNDNTQDIIQHNIPIKKKELDPLELVTCNLREDEINEIKSWREINENITNEFQDLNTSVLSVNGVKKKINRNHYKELRLLRNIPFKIESMD